MAATHSKSSSAEKQSRMPNDDDFVSLSTVNELMKAQETALKSFFTTFIENNNKRVDKLIEDYKELTISLEYTQAEVNDLKAEVNHLAEIATEEESKISSYDGKVKAVNEKVKDLEDKTDDLENRSRRSNLCFDGVIEDLNESWSTTEKKVREILSTKLKIETTEYTIERAHRVGKKNATGKPRSIVTKFNNFKVKENILRNKKGLKGNNIFVREDFLRKH